jgi:hypothetical protein
VFEKIENSVSIKSLGIDVSNRLEICAFWKHQFNPPPRLGGRLAELMNEEIVSQPNVRIASFSGTSFFEARIYPFTSGKRGSV